MATGTHDGQSGTSGALLPHIGRADIHLHTDVVDGLQSVTQLLDYAEEQTDLDLVAITDHDEIQGALAARDR
ncbi:MAG: hypothetical protein M3008_12270, partial [Chloroflexota bacterium]|nr:hypothetical protein [Chloroflexota bacterium]